MLFVIPVLSVTKTKRSGGILCPIIWFKSHFVNPVAVLCDSHPLKSIGAITKLNFAFVRWFQYFMRDIMLWLGSEIAFCLPVLMSLSFYSNFIVIRQFIAV